MAETYHVLDWRGLPLKTAATLAAGLYADSRAFRKLNGQKLKTSQYIGYAILDQLRLLTWLHTKNGAEGKQMPEPILGMLIEGNEKKTGGFQTAEEFEAAREKIVKGGMK